jgi:hypothetical protein
MIDDPCDKDHVAQALRDLAYYVSSERELDEKVEEHVCVDNGGNIELGLKNQG